MDEIKPIYVYHHTTPAYGSELRTQAESLFDLIKYFDRGRLDETTLARLLLSEERVPLHLVAGPLVFTKVYYYQSIGELYGKIQKEIQRLQRGDNIQEVVTHFNLRFSRALGNLGHGEVMGGAVNLWRPLEMNQQD